MQDKRINKRRLLLVGDNVTDPKSWSGTPFAIYSELQKQGIDVVPFNPYSWYKTIIGKCIVHLFGKTILPFFGNELSRWDQIILGFIIKWKLKKEGISNVFYMGNGVRISNSNIKSYLFCDAIVQERYKFYPYHRCENTLKYKLLKLLLYKSEKRHFLSMEHIFTQSDWVKNYLHDDLGYPEDKVEKVGFGLNVKLLEGKKNHDNNLLLIVLRKGSEKLKGLCLLLEAFKEVKKQKPEVRLAVVGTDGEKQDGVTYYYNQPRSVTLELFKQATLYVMPALNEPNGQTYLEGLANKAPIVGLNRFAFPEFSGYGKYGYICQNEDPKELADILIQALSNKETLIDKANAGYNFIANLDYNWENIVKRFIEVIFK